MKIRKRADSITFAGVASRGNFEPHGWAKEQYLWFKDNGGLTYPRESFCRYWKIALIWTPLIRLGDWTVGKERAIGVVLAIWYALIAIVFAFTIWQVALGMGVVAGAVVLVTLVINGLVVWFMYLSYKTIEWTVGIICALIATIIIWGLVDSYGWWTPLIVLAGLVTACGKRIYYKSLTQCQDTSKSVPVEKVPSALATVGHTIVDIIVLVVQVIRVTKWKICPLMDPIKDDK